MEQDVPVDVPHESMEPHGRVTLEELFNRWDDVRKKMQAMLGEIDSDNIDKLVYRHPYAGPLDMAETLNFIDVHFDNHVRHIDVILERAPK